MKTQTKEIRVYPACCTSAYCGRLNCVGCRNLPTKQAFLAWVKETNARVEDPIWCPTVWTGLKGVIIALAVAVSGCVHGAATRDQVFEDCIGDHGVPERGWSTREQPIRQFRFRDCARQYRGGK